MSSLCQLEVLLNGSKLIISWRSSAPPPTYKSTGQNLLFTMSIYRNKTWNSLREYSRIHLSISHKDSNTWDTLSEMNITRILIGIGLSPRWRINWDIGVTNGSPLEAATLWLNTLLKDNRSIGWHWKPSPRGPWTNSKNSLITSSGLGCTIAIRNLWKNWSYRADGGLGIFSLSILLWPDRKSVV